MGKIDKQLSIEESALIQTPLSMDSSRANCS